jgi:hypothetical protein
VSAASCTATMTTKIDRKMALLKAYPRCIDIDRASPPVSPNVVAATLTTQNPIVTSGTLLKPVFQNLLRTPA